MLKFAQEFSDFLESDESGMVIDAKSFFKEAVPEEEEHEQIVFRLGNGKLVRRLVSIWELFDHHDWFQRCVQQLAVRLISIQDKKRFSLLITSSPVMEELSRHVLPIVQNSGHEPIRSKKIDALSMESFSIRDELGRPSESGVVLADVIDNGDSIVEIAVLANRKRVGIVGALSLVVTGEELLKEEPLEGCYSLPSRIGSRIPVHTLATFPIPAVRDPKGSRVVRVDPFTLRPRAIHKPEPTYQPLVELDAALKYVESADCLQAGFQRAGNQRFSYSVEIPLLLKSQEKEIWEAIQMTPAKEANLESLDQVVIATSNRYSDLCFRDFFQKKLEQRGLDARCLVALIPDGGSQNSPALIGSSVKQDIEGSTVILLIATLTTSERLRALVALLYEQRVGNIVVLNLINRMSNYTTRFIGSIEKLSNRVAVDRRPRGDLKVTFTDFSFFTILGLPELPDEELVRLEKSITTISTEMSRNCITGSFKRLSAEVARLFSFQDLAEMKIPTKRGVIGSETECRSKLRIRLRDREVEARSHAGKIALVTIKLVIEDDFEPLIEELLLETHPSTIDHYFGLLLTDAPHLRYRGTVQQLGVRVLQRVADLRQSRFSLERESRNSGIREEGSLSVQELKAALRASIELELSLLQGVAILAYRDSPASFEESDVIGMINAGNDKDEWRGIPLNFRLHFESERLFFLVALVLHGLHSEFPREKVATGVKKKLIDTLKPLRSLAQEIAERASDAPVEGRIGEAQSGADQDVASVPLGRRRDEMPDDGFSEADSELIRENIDTLLAELGFHKQRRPHQIVRFLHRRVLRPRKHHNHISNSLTDLLSALQDVVPDGVKATESILLDDYTQSLVDQALTGTKSLTFIAENARQLFMFTPTTGKTHSRYTALASQDGFLSDIVSCIGLLKNINRTGTLTAEDRDSLRNYAEDIDSDFSDSELRRALQSYLVPLEDCLIWALRGADVRLRDSMANAQAHAASGPNGLEGMLVRKARALSSLMRDIPARLVLSDQQILKEFFRNFFHNLRYVDREVSYCDWPDDLFDLTIHSTYRSVRDEGEKPFAEIRIRVDGTIATEDYLADPSRSIGYQYLRLQKFGAQCEIDHDVRPSVFSLYLMRRDEFARPEGKNLDQPALLHEVEHG